LTVASAERPLNLIMMGSEEDFQNFMRIVEAAGDSFAKNEVGYAILKFAVMLGRPELVASILDKGFDVNLQDERYGYTPLHLAAFHGNKGVAELLIENGANVELPSKGCGGIIPGRTAAELARFRGHEELAALLEHAAGV